MPKMALTLIACCVVLATSSASAQSSPSPERTSSSMLKRLLQGDARLGRNGVPADRTYEARAVVADPLFDSRKPYITDEYGLQYDRRGNRIR